MFSRRGSALIIGSLALITGFGVARLINQQPTAERVSLEVIEGGLSIVQPGRCEVFTTSGGYRSVRVSGPLVENLGDQAQIISTEFRVFTGNGEEHRTTDREYDSFREWRVPVEEVIRDVVLVTEGRRAAQRIDGDVTRCILFIERKGTYLPPFEGPPPGGDGAGIGIKYDYSWFVHCGANLLQFDGRWWRPAIPLSGNPHGSQSGWDENDEAGVIELLSEQRARFTTRGDSVDLVPRVAPTYNPNACE